MNLWFFKTISQSSIQSCLTPSNPMDCSPPGLSIHGIFQARVLEWVAIAFSDRDHSLVYLNETKPCCVGSPRTDG